MKLKLPGCNIGDVCLIACDPEHGSDFREFIIICILLCAEKQSASWFPSKLAACNGGSIAVLMLIPEGGAEPRCRRPPRVGRIGHFTSWRRSDCGTQASICGWACCSQIWKWQPCRLLPRFTEGWLVGRLYWLVCKNPGNCTERETKMEPIVFFPPPEPWQKRNRYFNVCVQP